MVVFQPLILKEIEASAFSVWLRESSSVFAFYFILCFHTIGMVLLVGPSAALDLRLLGVASDLPIEPMRKFFSFMYAGLAINIVSGVLLLWAYPTKAFTNPDFYIKLSLIAFGMWVIAKIKEKVFGDATLSDSAKMAVGSKLALISLVTWVAVITAGRLLAYTYTYLLYGAYAPGG